MGSLFPTKQLHKKCFGNERQVRNGTEVPYHNNVHVNIVNIPKRDEMGFLNGETECDMKQEEEMFSYVELLSSAFEGVKPEQQIKS